jgi:hypothetical protein
MAFIVGFGASGDFDDANMGWVERADQPLEDRPLAGAYPAFEQDDRPLAVDDLRKLQARQALLKRLERFSGVSGERFPPFKFR